ncbi:hypothetical protein [Xenophilus sp. Marseille-Q4582]|uniref:hypothetical protein n=1 Tax=Xenophilus sp. Marseille-Q4582 TaxID=2866600 RepID=UPI001CE3FC9D|nr:hypothetical protein [Xenophilus sp. Marseille-Q4582]
MTPSLCASTRGARQRERPSAARRRGWAVPGTGAALLLWAAAAGAQPSLAQQRFDEQVSLCNRAGLPAPQRQACIRDAGRQLDRASGGSPPPLVPRTSADGRAEVMAPPGAPPPPSGPQFVPSPDGRALLGVPPAGDRLERP